MSSKLYVGNLGYNVESSALESQFANYGSVVSCKIITDRDTNRSKGFGFVEMSSQAEAQDAINGLNGFDLGGRQMNVTEAKPMAPRSNSRY